MKAKFSRRFLLPTAVITLLACLGTGAQELSTFLSHLPGPGAWARYRLETRENGHSRRKMFIISAISGDVLNGTPYVWLELGRTNFAGFKNGYMRILIKQTPSDEEASNPFLAAFSLAYQEPGRDPFELSSGALSFMHNRAAKIKVMRQSEALPPGDAKSLKGVLYHCSVIHLTTTTVTEFFGKSYNVVEEGKYWLSKDTPFQIVRAEIKRSEQKKDGTKVKNITVVLRKSSFKGARSRFTKPVKDRKGLFGILFHH